MSVSQLLSNSPILGTMGIKQNMQSIPHEKKFCSVLTIFFLTTPFIVLLNCVFNGWSPSSWLTATLSLNTSHNTVRYSCGEISHCVSSRIRWYSRVIASWNKKKTYVLRICHLHPIGFRMKIKHWGASIGVAGKGTGLGRSIGSIGSITPIGSITDQLIYAN